MNNTEKWLIEKDPNPKLSGQAPDRNGEHWYGGYFNAPAQDWGHTSVWVPTIAAVEEFFRSRGFRRIGEFTGGRGVMSARVERM